MKYKHAICWLKREIDGFMNKKFAQFITPCRMSIYEQIKNFISTRKRLVLKLMILSGSYTIEIIKAFDYVDWLDVFLAIRDWNIFSLFVKQEKLKYSTEMSTNLMFKEYIGHVLNDASLYLTINVNSSSSSGRKRLKWLCL